jgi:hypothetical protein
MTHEAQRIAIAEACGWVREYADVPTWDASFNSYKGGYKPVRTMLFRRKEKCFLAENLPDYLNDLNAMHVVEKSLSWKDEGSSTSERRRYLMNLEAVISGPADRYGDRPDRTLSVPFATAAQRAEAFLRTLGKWGEAA